MCFDLPCVLECDYPIVAVDEIVRPLTIGLVRAKIQEISQLGASACSILSGHFQVIVGRRDLLPLSPVSIHRRELGDLWL